MSTRVPVIRSKHVYLKSARVNKLSEKEVCQKRKTKVGHYLEIVKKNVKPNLHLSLEIVDISVLIWL